MFVRYVIADEDTGDRKVFGHREAGLNAFRIAQRGVLKGEYELAVLFHVPGTDNARVAAAIVDNVVAGKPVSEECHVVEIEQSQSRRMGDLFRTAFADVDWSFLADLAEKKK
ncbi:MAG: hypothetical protein RIB57_13570 [Pelagibacterium sp.]|uniref:hypothetical protein n=1 Tax=Pelagibacterium sp. TaxID=1967288 RepID=UPI0032EB4D79